MSKDIASKQRASSSKAFVTRSLLVMHKVFQTGETILLVRLWLLIVLTMSMECAVGAKNQILDAQELSACLPVMRS